MSEPWIRHEDDDLLVVSKPSGVTTHRVDTYAQEGMHEWVQSQRPVDRLSVLHRLDKATSGLLVFGKTAAANRSLADQFERRSIQKDYELVVANDSSRPGLLECSDPIEASGSRLMVDAMTSFERGERGEFAEQWIAHPHTGRTHQVRIHAQHLGMPILGDADHGGPPAARLALHAAGLRFLSPTGSEIALSDEPPDSVKALLAASDANGPDIRASAAFEARAALFDPEHTNAYLGIDRHHDGFPDVRVERLGDTLLVICFDKGVESVPTSWIGAWTSAAQVESAYLLRRPRGGGGSPARLLRGGAGGATGPEFAVRELGCEYRIDLAASATSTGLFLDQRETRRRLLKSDLAGKKVLNAFGHTGAFSVAAAKAGAETLTLDLSRRYLDWARDNFDLNELDSTDHDFVYGDALEWMDRFARKGREFDLVIVDPPSSSTPARQSKQGGRWVVERDLHSLVERASRLCAPSGTVYVSTNLRRMTWPRFLDHLAVGLVAAGRSAVIETQTLSIDHRSGPGDPPYLKAAWLTLDSTA